MYPDAEELLRIFHINVSPNSIADGTVVASLAQRNFLKEWLAAQYLHWLNNHMIEALARLANGRRSSDPTEH